MKFLNYFESFKRWCFKDSLGYFLSGNSKILQNYLKFKLFELVGKILTMEKIFFRCFFRFCVFLFWSFFFSSLSL